MKQAIYLKDIKLVFEEHAIVPDMYVAEFRDFSILRSPKNRYYPLKYEVWDVEEDDFTHFAGIEEVRDHIKERICGRS